MADDIAAAPTAGEDERRLHELGYAQELMRRMSGFSNFAVSFTIISILSGCLTLYGYGMNTGGPAIIVWGWPIVGLFTLTVGLAMAEVCSSFPTAGGLYYWSAKLARKNGPAWSWFTGWFNFLGQVAVTAGIDFGCAFFINAFLNLTVGRQHRALGDDPDPGHRAVRPRRDEPVRHQAGRAAQRHQRLVARHRRADHRGRAGLRALQARVGQLRVQPHRQQHRVAQHVLRAAARPAAGPVHASPGTTPRRT
jgi:Amino acid transporters